MTKRGLSPVIATVLLIAIVIVIGLIVFLWFKGIQAEAITKFDGENVKLVCENVEIEASYSSGTVYVSNTGNVPVYKIKARVSSKGSYSTETLGDGGSWPNAGLNQGGTYSGGLTHNGDELLLIPVLIGETSTEEKAYTCEEDHGITISMV